VFDARPGDVVLGSGLSPGVVPGTRAGQQLIFPFAEASPPRIVYRVIRPDENPALGLFAKNPSATYSVQAFVLRGRYLQTQYIATTRDINAARRYSRLSGNPVVAVDVLGLEASSIIDLSSELGRSSYLTRRDAINFARKSGEVLILRQIPPQTILPYIPLGNTP